MRSLSILLSLAISMSGSPALAEGVPSAPSAGSPALQDVDRFMARVYGEESILARSAEDDASQVGDVEARIAALKNERDAISTRGPRAATITGAVLTGVGFGVAGIAGIICAAAAAGSSTQCKVENAAGIAGGGVVVGIAGVITLLSGRARLKERNQQREVLEQEIRSLEGQRAERLIPTIGYGIGGKSDPGVVLGWRF